MLPLELINHILSYCDIHTIVKTKTCFKNDLCDYQFWLTKFQEFYILNELISKSFYEWCKVYHDMVNAQEEAHKMMKIVRASYQSFKLFVHHGKTLERFFSLNFQKKYELDQAEFYRGYFNIYYDNMWHIMLYFKKDDKHYQTVFDIDDPRHIASLISEVLLNYKIYGYDITDGLTTIIYDKSNAYNHYKTMYKLLGHKNYL